MADPRTMLPQPDLVGAYLAGIQAREAGQRRKMNDVRLSQAYAEQQQSDTDRRALGYYRQTGDFEALQRAAPQVAEQIAKQQAEQRAARIDEAGKLSVISDRENRFAAEQAKIRAERTAEEQKRAAMALQQNPAVAPFLKKRIDLLTQRGEIDAFDLPGQHLMSEGEVGPQVLPNEQEVATFGAMAGVEQPKAPEPDKDYITFSRLYPQYKEGSKEKAAAFDAWNRANRKSGASSVNNVLPGGGIGLTAAEATANQADIRKADDRTEQLDEIEAAIKAVGGYDNFALITKATEADMGNLWSRLGFKGGDREALAARARVMAAIGGFTNPVISELAGANVPESEFGRITQSLPDPTRDSGPQLEAKIRAWRRSTEQLRGRRVSGLKGGIKDKPGAGAPERTRIRLPDGRTATLPQTQVEAFISQNPGTQVVE